MTGPASGGATTTGAGASGAGGGGVAQPAIASARITTARSASARLRTVRFRLGRGRRRFMAFLESGSRLVELRVELAELVLAFFGDPVVVASVGEFAAANCA